MKNFLFALFLLNLLFSGDLARAGYRENYKLFEAYSRIQNINMNSQSLTPDEINRIDTYQQALTNVVMADAKTSKHSLTEEEIVIINMQKLMKNKIWHCRLFLSDLFSL
jgi:hypothetical protein